MSPVGFVATWRAPTQSVCHRPEFTDLSIGIKAICAPGFALEETVKGYRMVSINPRWKQNFHTPDRPVD
jgi:hypothetical protein